MDFTKEELKELIGECLANLESLGKDFRIDDDLHVSLDLFESTGTLGQCGMQPVPGTRTFAHLITFNKYLMYHGLKDLIINNIYHEFCHYFQNKEAIRNGFFYFDENGTARRKSSDPKLLDYYVGKDNGHSECWFKYVNKVNSKLKPAIPVTAHPDEIQFNKFLDTNAENVLFSIQCESCGKGVKFLNYNEYDYSALPVGLLAKLASDAENGVKNNYCKCGGCLKLTTKNKETLYNILDKERDRMLSDMLHNFGRR